jgi:hypothetical protein
MTAAGVMGAPAPRPRVLSATVPACRGREARLHPEFADRYPNLPAGEWISAAVVADRVLARSLLVLSGGHIRGRVLPDDHFEFRHGTAGGGERHGVRLRRET